MNYYVGNQSVLLPVYEDPNDEVAVHIMKELFPEKTIVSIDVQALYKNGGMTVSYTHLTLPTNSLV